MKKSILNLGKALNKAEQKNINGGDVLLYPPPVNGCPCHSYFDPMEGICVEPHIHVLSLPCDNGIHGN